jgi:A/G-specific adenine glycosylase
MDLGATLCSRSKPSCAVCPLAARCVALATGRVHELPQRKPKKVIPDKQTAMLLVIDRNQVLLEQRPASGIWGGLLSLPELAVPAAISNQPGAELAPLALERALARFGKLACCQPLPSFQHVFTHFRLRIWPYRITLERRLQLVGESPHVWYRFDQLAQAPLPAPVKKLLLEQMANQA